MKEQILEILKSHLHPVEGYKGDTFPVIFDDDLEEISEKIAALIKIPQP